MGLGVVGILLLPTFPLVALACVVLGAGGVLVASSGAALLADASRSLARFRLFGQRVAISTGSAFLASAIAGALAGPVALTLGVPERDVWTIRVVTGIGGLIAAASIVPTLMLRRARIEPGSQPPAARWDLLRRFIAIEVCWGIGAGSFLPFQNLFFADRFGVPFAGLGIVLGAITMSASLGSLFHARWVVPLLGFPGSFTAVVLASVPFALAAALAGDMAFAAGALAARAALVFGAAASLNAFTLSSFTAAERVGAYVITSIAYNASNALGAFSSGYVRAWLGDAGWIANLATLAVSYALSALLARRLFAQHHPGDAVGAPGASARDSLG